MDAPGAAELNLLSATVDGLLLALEAEGVEISADQRRRAVNRLLYGVPYSPAEERLTDRIEAAGWVFEPPTFETPFTPPPTRPMLTADDV